MNKFYVIDVETANADYSSICQIGIAEFTDGKLTDTWETLVNPKDYFDEMNISIHGIDETMVQNAPPFDQIYEKIKALTENNIVGHHMPFDRIAINRACDSYRLDHIGMNWLDSAKIVRRTWEQFAYKGFGLAPVSDYLGIEFKHHNALEDAIATGKVMLKAFEHSGISLNEWIVKVTKRITPRTSSALKISMEGNPDGSLYGEKIVFTGTLFIARSEAAKMAADLGCDVVTGVSRNTTILVVGAQDDYKLAGYAKSSKHRKAEELIKAGVGIRILSEDDFRSLARL